MMARRFKWVAACALGALLGGCLVGPDYRRPEAPVPAAYRELAGWTEARPADGAPKGDWWTAFHDPLLDELEPQVAVSNLTVRQSEAAYRQALAEVTLARSALYPLIGLGGGINRTGGGTAGASALAQSGSVGSATLEGTAAWSPDLWGRLRRQVEQAAAVAQTDEALLANATLSQQMLLAVTVIELRLADASIELARRSVAAYGDTLRVVAAQGSAGVTFAPPSAVIGARVTLESAQANLIGLGVARAQFAHAIAVLVGRNPEDLEIPPSAAMPSLPEVPLDVPSTLLERRPDVAAAERTVAAQNAAVGVAIAAYYPSLTLSAAAGFSQAPLAGLLHAANHVWSLGANANETLLDFGARQANVAAAKAAYEGSVASYRATVLGAFQAVENDLSGLRILGEQARALDVAVTDAIRGSAIALAEFQAGTVDYTTVAQAQQLEFSDRQSALAVEQSRLIDAVSLIGDLGGGWSADRLHAP